MNENFTFPLTVSTITCDEKPTNARPYQLMSNYQTKQSTIKEFCTDCVEGHAWRAGIYEEGANSFKKTNVVGSQILALDFDAVPFSPEEVVEFAAKRHIKPNFFYYSLSQDISRVDFEQKFPASVYIYRNGKILLKNGTENRRTKEGYNYRLVWVLDRQIDRADYEAIVKTFIQNTFAKFNPDKATKDISRLWYGGCTCGKVVNDEPTDLDNVLRVYGEDKIDSGVRKNNLKRDKKMRSFIDSNPAPKDRLEVPGDWENYLIGRCPIWEKWTKGEYIAYEDGRHELEANLAFLTYGNHRNHVLDDVFKYYNAEAYEGHSDIIQEFQTKYNKPYDWNPHGIVYVGGQKPITMYEFFSRLDYYTKGGCIKPSKEGYVELEELEEDMEIKFNQLFNTDGVSYFISQTGSGKTEQILRLIKNGKIDCSNQKVIYSVPQYITAHEFVERLNKDTEFKKFEYFTISPNDYSEQGLARMKLGLSSGDRINDERKESISKLMDAEQKGLFIITHALLANLKDIPADLIIIDENIEECLAPLKSITVDTMLTLTRFLDPALRQDYMEFVNGLYDMERGKAIEEPILYHAIQSLKKPENLKAYINEYISKPEQIAEGLFDIIDDSPAAVKLTRDDRDSQPAISFVKRSRVVYDAILNNIPIKLLTATPMCTYLKAMYETEVHVIEVKRGKNKGKLINYTKLSGARGMNNEKVMELAKNAFNTIPRKPTDPKLLAITYKGADKIIEEAGFEAITHDGTRIHFHNNRGLDFLKGRELVVLGKPDKSPEYYYRLWDVIGDGTELNSSTQWIYRNGIQQKLFLFNNETMREIQLDNLEYALSQTIGRARALREETATVYIFSNYISKDVDEVFYK